jgi:truncated hemoglobin YjbI
MNISFLRRSLLLLILGAGLVVGQSNGQTLGGLFEMLGGMETVKKLSGSFLQSAASDPRLAGLLGKADTGALAPKLADQMCSMLGGKCTAPLTDQQIAAGTKKVDASQTEALGKNFSSALNAVTGNPLVMEGVSKAIAPKLGGIVGALL